MQEPTNKITPDSGESNAPDPSPLLQEMKDQIAGLAASHATSSAFLADPDVQKLLQLKAAGKSFALAEQDEDLDIKDPLDEFLRRQTDGTDTGGDGDEMTTKELLAHMGTTLPEVISRNVKEAMRPMHEELEALKADRLDEQQQKQIQKTQSDISDTAKKHADFGDYKDDMIALNEGGLSVEDLYLLAKVKKVGLPTETSTSERPHNILSTRSQSIKPDEPRRGLPGFKQMLDDAHASRRQ